MGSKNKITELLRTLGGIAVSATLVYFGTGLHPACWATWFALIPVLWFAGRQDSRAVFLVAMAAWLIGGLTWWHYLHAVIELPVIVCIEILAIPSLLLGLCVLLWRRMLLQGRLSLAAFWLPVAWTAVGFLQQIFSPHSTFGNVAYSQMDFLLLIQVASVTGIWGVAFFLMLAPSTIAVLLHCGPAAKGVAAFTLAAFVLTIGFGVWRLHVPIETTGTIRAQLMMNNTDGEIFAHTDSRSLELLRKYTAE